MSRTETLVLVDAGGALLGALPPVRVELPWWPEVADVVAEARSRHGADVQVLRLLDADRPHPPGGRVTYLAQVFSPPAAPLAPADVDLAPHPLRAPYAVPGGPAASVAWALAASGRHDLTAVQQRTWNLSMIWRLEAAGQPVAWLKQVPPMFAHEPAVLALVGGFAPGLVPTVLRAGPPGRMLLGHVPGEDRYEAGADLCAAVAADWHPAQVHFAGRVDELLAAGVPDGRFDADRFARVAEPFLDGIDGLAALVDELPARFAAIEACGLPATLVHGDLHPGNVRADGDSRVIVDWGDATVGHPAYDILRLTGELDEPGPVLREWARRWRTDRPGAEPERAVALIRPVAELRAAAAYADFLDRIEPSEWPYHAADVPARLRAAAAAAVRWRCD
ncbi:phosphotransferase family protein [Actinoplanes nipponensis]|uniref:phosphotransferase family protein n=1 Tax=Actinoplanes nipponensis TaxID=135950 RepID=UPI0019435D63|nr:phosphotransferase [Actinoplanes nipponensis]